MFIFYNISYRKRIMKKNRFALAMTCALSTGCAVDPYTDQRTLSDSFIGALGSSALCGAADLLLGASLEVAASGAALGRAANHREVIEIFNA
jgi:hypothetical protein